MLISDLGRLCHTDPEFRFEQRISTVILSTANGMFLLALLYMKPFKVKLNAVEVEYALKSCLRVTIVPTNLTWNELTLLVRLIRMIIPQLLQLRYYRGLCVPTDLSAC